MRRKLQESEQQYRRITENITDVVWISDMNLRVTYVSPSIEKMTGETPEEVYRKPATKRIPLSSLIKLRAILAEELKKEKDPAVDKNRTRIIEAEHFKADGTLISISMNISFIRDKHGKPAGLQGITRDITENKRNEEALRGSEAKYRLLIENMNDSLVQLDKKGNIQLVNENLCGMFGYPENELIGQAGFKVLIHKDDQSIIKTEMKSMMSKSDKLAEPLEIRGIKKTGDAIWLRISGSVLRESDGKPNGSVFLMSDITRQKKGTIQLQSMNEALLAIKEASIRFAAKKNPEEIYPLIAETFQKLTGAASVTFSIYDPEKKCTSVKYAEIEKGLLKGLIQATGNKKILESDFPLSETVYNEMLENQIKKTDSMYEATFGSIPKSTGNLFKKIFSIESFLGIAFFIDDQLYGTSLVALDKNAKHVSEQILKSFAQIVAITLYRIRAEGELRESEEKYRMIVERANDGIEISQNDKIIFSNPRFADMLGYTADEIKNISFSDIFTGQALSELYSRFEKRQKGESEPHQYSTTFRKKDGTLIDVEVNYEITDYKGSPATFAIIRDITEYKKAEEKIRTLLKEKDLLLKETHHRIKNNMEVIKSLLALHASRLTDPKTSDILKDASGRVQSMSVLYDKLYRSDTYKELSIKTFLPPLINEIISLFPHDPPVKADINVEDIVLPSKLLSSIGIIINECITNSMKYAFSAGKEGKIDVSVYKKDSHAVIEYCDSGPGLPKTVDVDSSSGFGMKLIRILAEQIEAELDVERNGRTKYVLKVKV